MKNSTLLLCIVFVFSAPSIWAQSTISFQGKLIEDGNPVNGTRNFQFSIPDVSWTEDHTNVTVLDGLYSVTLGDGDTPTPLPQLFEGASERQLIISVEGNVLTPVALKAPYQNRFFDGTVTTNNAFHVNDAATTLASLSVVDDGNGGKEAILELSRTDGTSFTIDPDGITVDQAIFSASENIGADTELTAISGEVSGVGADAFSSKYSGVLGKSTVTGDGDHAAVRGILDIQPGNTGFSRGVQAEVTSTDPSATAYGIRADMNGEFGFMSAIRGLALNTNPNGNNWGGDFTAGENPTENIGVVGRINGTGQPGTNIGVKGQADRSGSGTNIGVWGVAANGTDQNLAGKFDGDVEVNGNMHFPDPDGAENNGAIINNGSFSVFGVDNEINGQLVFNWNAGGNEGRNRGALFLWGDEAMRTATGLDTRRIDLTVSDDDFGGDVGRLIMRGPQASAFGGPTEFVELGVFAEDAGASHFGRLALRGTEIYNGTCDDDGDPNTPEVPCSFNPDLIELRVEKNNNNSEIGVIYLNSADGSSGLRISSEGIDGGGGGNIQVNAPNGEQVYSANYISNNGDNPPFAGESFHWGNNTPNVQIGAPVWEENNDGAERGFINLYGSTPDGGWYRQFVNLSVNKENGNEYGIFGLEGPSTPNVSFSAHGYQGGNGADRPFFDMYGSTSTSDPNDTNCDDPNTPEFEACINFPSLINFDIQDDGNGNEIGVLHLRSTDGSEFRLDPNGLGGGNNAFSYIDILNQSGDNNVINLNPQGPNGNHGNIRIADTDDSEESTRVNLGVQDFGSGSFGYLNLSSPIKDSNVGNGECDDPNTPEVEPCVSSRPLATLDIRNDQGGNDPNGWHGALSLFGSNTPNINLGAHQYENNDLPFIHMFGTTTETDTNNPSCDDPNTPETEFCTFNPVLVEFDVQNDGNGNEIGVLHLRSTDGTDYRLDPFGPSNNSFSFVSIQNGAGTNNTVELGSHGPNQNLGFLNLKGSDDAFKASLSVNNDGGNEWGALSLNSPSGYDNLFTNYKTWEPGNEDLPLFTMRGSQQQSGGLGDCDGDPNTPDEECFFRPDLLSLQVNGNAMAQAGSLNFTNNTGSSSIDIYMAGDNFNGPSIDLSNNGNVPLSLHADENNNSFINMHGPNGSQIVNLGSGGSDGNFGRLSLYDDSGTNRVELNVTDQGSGELSLGSSSNTLNVSLGGHNTGNNFGRVGVHDDTGAERGFFGVQEGGGLPFATVSVANTNGNSVDIQGDGVIHMSHPNASFTLWNFDDGVHFYRDSDPGDGNGIGGVLEVEGDNFVHIDGRTGDINAGGLINGTTVGTSDGRLKTGIETLKNPLENTLRMRGVSFKWRDPAKTQRTQIGVIAQEVEAIYPEFVHTDSEGMKSVNYSQMVAVLIESVKELNAKIVALEKENSDLKVSLQSAELNSKRIESLTSQLSSLQQLINNVLPKPQKSDDDINITEQK